jgi:hypothetical protein
MFHPLRMMAVPACLDGIEGAVERRVKAAPEGEQMAEPEKPNTRDG